MKIIECDQGSPEWHAARCGKVTASRVADIVRKGRNGEKSKMRQTYAGELVAERLSGFQAESFTSGPMQWGKDQEDAAREMYGFARSIQPVRVGFVIHPAISMAGASPDSLIGDDGMIEIKCPNSATHIETLLSDGLIDPDYVKQMQWGMACTGRQWCDFVSYDPRMPPEMQMDVRRVHRDPQMISDLECAVVLFLEEVAATVEKLQAKFMREAA